METVLGSVASVVAASVAIYAAALVGARVAGRRTLAQMSAFDALVTIAIGTIVGSAALGGLDRLLPAVVSLTTIFSLQILIGLARRRWSRFRRLVDFGPIVLARDGDVDERALAAAHMTRRDLEERLQQLGRREVPRTGEVVLGARGEIAVVGPR